MFEQQEEMRRKEQEAHMKELEKQKFTEDVHEECEDWKCQECNPPPPTHPEYGPPVYDPYFKCWTYPYA